ncbi:hypothetical protein B2J93_6935 [Marssonina coronariae]|uniref:Methyltransferase domain-containing protein n=1 Tax=Diplocarpon coronariae TaxID=2795749 RepID=A0A218YVS8_9HELO|nr:hypothetical protein B2J93_6935 [Marssonina coronariae]
MTPTPTPTPTPFIGILDLLLPDVLATYVPITRNRWPIPSPSHPTCTPAPHALPRPVWAPGSQALERLLQVHAIPQSAVHHAPSLSCAVVRTLCGHESLHYDASSRLRSPEGKTRTKEADSAELVQDARGQRNAADGPSPPPPPNEAVPPVLDDHLFTGGMDEDDKEVDEEVVRYRLKAARTLFRQPTSDSDTLNSTRSLYDSDIVFLDIHGRRYTEDYFMPNDQPEQDRMQMMHDIFLYAMDGQLTTVPLENPEMILDVGTGCGDWAMEMGEKYPNSEVIGIDIAKIQSTVAPPNVFFQVDDAEEEGGWTFQEDTFDLVHLRGLSGAFRDWNHVYSEAYVHLKPGGWIEVMDYDNHSAFLRYFANDPDFQVWFKALMEATSKAGRPRDAGHLEPSVLIRAGFTDVSFSTKAIPFGIWPEGEQEQAIGGRHLITQLHGIEALSLRPFTEQLGWDPDRVRELCKKVWGSVKTFATDPERSKGLSVNMRILVGRKPCGSNLEIPTPDGSSVTGDSTQTGKRMGGN